MPVCRYTNILICYPTSVVIMLIPVSVKSIPPEKNAHWNISFQITKSGAGQQFLLPGCRGKGSRKGSVCSQTPAY